ncbi:flagellar assembly protein FliH [Inmirania thermothiophila]|uniref:Flagellar assembly protein FliH n=1 Tax=Inmirania thermothiophila TaxID=1750597 RepID=A0A3N1Y8R3_9GAMM|nr:flagellar assembly protein FliH [Inmirania thermothiophila]ROR34931.1 flagellar assembly protein FliH [Inmirania thermothiophila]
MSRLLRGERAGEAERWQAPEVGASGTVRRHALPTAEEIERIQRQAWEEGFTEGREAGYREGRAAGEAEVRAAARRLEALCDLLARPLQALDEEVERELVQLALAVAQQLVRRELRTDPGEVVAVVREALAALPVAERLVRVHLHPEDAALVREALSLSGEERAWKVVEDPTITRGGCRVETDVSRLDATVENRLAVIAARLLGGEREADGHAG